MKEEKKILLIHKIITGVATPEEKRLFDRLKSNGIEDAKLVNDITYLWKHKKGTSDKFHKENAKAKLFASIEMDTLKKVEEPQEVKIFNIKRLMSIAAIFVIVIAALFVFQKYNSNSSFTGDHLVTNIKALPELSKNINSIKMYKLSDFTKVWTDIDTKISVNDGFSKEERVVKLDGTAFFDVSKDKKHPFTIEMKGFEVKVLGTSFQIVTGDNGVEVDVYSGVVEFLNKKYNKMLLQAGEGALFDNSLQRFVKINREDFRINTKESYLVFKGNTLKEVLTKLSNFYEVKINIDCKSIDDLGGFTSPRFAGNDIEDYFSTIKKLYDLSIKKSDNGDFTVTCD